MMVCGGLVGRGIIESLAGRGHPNRLEIIAWIRSAAIQMVNIVSATIASICLTTFHSLDSYNPPKLKSITSQSTCQDYSTIHACSDTIGEL